MIDLGREGKKVAQAKQIINNGMQLSSKLEPPRDLAKNAIKQQRLLVWRYLRAFPFPVITMGNVLTPEEEARWEEECKKILFPFEINNAEFAEFGGSWKGLYDFIKQV